MKEIEIANNSLGLAATLFDNADNEVVLLIASATGVKQTYYRKFAEYANRHGVTVITFDYTGIGNSLKQPIQELNVNAADWGSNDLESVIQYAINNYPESKKVILGHSIGGQLIGLAPSSSQLDKVILVAAQSGYWRFWKGLGRIKMWFNWHLLFPLLIGMFGYLKSKRISGMENLPKNVAGQWKDWCESKDYLFGDSSIEHKFHDAIEVDLTAYSIDDDDFAPRQAVQWMTDKYSNAKRKSIHLMPNEFQTKRIGHFGVFNERFRDSIWKQLLSEIL